ncbi:hypothetical protein PAALTS15_03422 [Paenibacillus alvei TS-15]|uniref:GerMN domain-containing protein n=1 Tax=Paenibacillus alvei TS-15 TaxID=1117108 RepID=S9SSC4_PAEAL|nr:GerMN domain-containing protein [Paenibacillus alvei]EPY08592.1 hypothetical protein PAALTS15_03422 [Paenibacillus alvei TS-15]
MKQSVSITILILVFAIIGTACGGKPATKSGAASTSNEGVYSPANGTDKAVDEDKDAARDKTEEIVVYFVDSQVTELKQSKMEIHYSDSLDKYKKVFKALQSNNPADLLSLWNKIELNAMKFHEGVLTIDVHIPGEARLGAGGELFALDALKETLFQFKEIDNIELLSDGKALDSFMGHAELEHPISRNKAE